MGLKLHVLSRSDPADLALIPAIARVHLAAWLSNSLYQTIYYGPPSSHAGVIEANRQRHLESFTSNPSTNFAVILDDELDGNSRSTASQVIAWVKYDVFATAQAEEERRDTGERTWPPYTNLRLVEDFWSLIVLSRQRRGKEIGPHVSVDLLATDPVHHRRGAGRMLMQHVADKATELDLPATLEASPDGLRLYTSVGFQTIDEFSVDLLRYEGGGDKGDEWARASGRNLRPGEGVGWYKQCVMVRPSKASKQ